MNHGCKPDRPRTFTLTEANLPLFLCPFKTAVENFSVYGASKAAVVALTKTAAKEWAKVPIRCNAVLPGGCDTEKMRSQPPYVMENAIKTTPLGRLATTEGGSCELHVEVYDFSNKSKIGKKKVEARDKPGDANQCD